jgi:hypothetical protein
MQSFDVPTHEGFFRYQTAKRNSAAADAALLGFAPDEQKSAIS